MNSHEVLLLSKTKSSASLCRRLTHDYAGGSWSKTSYRLGGDSGGKITRAQGISPLIEAGNVLLPHPMFMPWVNDFLQECASFPKGAHDEQVDAMTQSLLRWHEVPKEQTYVSYCDIVQISPV